MGYPGINIKFDNRKRCFNAFDVFHKYKEQMLMIGLIAEYLDERIEDYFAVLDK